MCNDVESFRGECSPLFQCRFASLFPDNLFQQWIILFRSDDNYIFMILCILVS